MHIERDFVVVLFWWTSREVEQYLHGYQEDLVEAKVKVEECVINCLVLMLEKENTKSSKRNKRK
jgi:hypothetical protein